MDFGIFRRFIGVVNTREVFNLTGASLFVKTFGALLSDNYQNRGDGFAEILIVQSHPIKVPYPLFISLAYPTPVPNI